MPSYQITQYCIPYILDLWKWDFKLVNIYKHHEKHPVEEVSLLTCVQKVTNCLTRMLSVSLQCLCFVLLQRWSNAERLLAIDRLIETCEPTQVRHMMQVIEPQFQRDFISLLPKEVSALCCSGIVWQLKLCSYQPHVPLFMKEVCILYRFSGN